MKKVLYSFSVCEREDGIVLKWFLHRLLQHETSPPERNDSNSVWLVTSWVREWEREKREKTTTVETRERERERFSDSLTVYVHVAAFRGSQFTNGWSIVFPLGLKADIVRKRNNPSSVKIKIETISNCIWWLTNDRSSSDAIGWSPGRPPPASSSSSSYAMCTKCFVDTFSLYKRNADLPGDQKTKKFFPCRFHKLKRICINPTRQLVFLSPFFFFFLNLNSKRFDKWSRT